MTEPPPCGDLDGRRAARRSRDAFGGSARRYLDLVGGALSDRIETAADLALLARFAQRATMLGGRALDAGCGTGRVTRMLADCGLDAIGVDIADGMVELADAEHSDLSFSVGELARLPFAASGFTAAVYWYSIITTPPTGLAIVFGELRRVLDDGGAALVAFQSGDGRGVERRRAYGTDVDLMLYHHDVRIVASALEAASLHVVDVVERDPEQQHEDTTQAFITVRG